MSDRIAQRMDQWKTELADVDTVGMAILGRARWITLRARQDIEAVFQRHDLDTGEFDVLATLLRSGSPYLLRPTELYRSLMISSGGLTGRLDRLEKRGLIEREKSEEDSRSFLVRLSAKGRSVAEQAFREDMAVEKDLLQCLDDGEKAQLATLLARLVAHLDDEGIDKSAAG